VFETGHNHDFDEVVVAACGPEEQIRRVMARDNLTDAEARARHAAQWPIEEKVKRANHVIWTDRGFAETERQVAEAYDLLRSDV
jgi:dephospho-CoA kinase